MIRLVAVFAALQCGSYDAMAAALVEKYGERQVSVEQFSDVMVGEFWGSDRGTWTLLATHADGSSCVMAVGTGWTPIERGVAL